VELNIAITRDKATIGFTIIDLMVVILVIVILAAAAVPVIAGVGGNAGVQQSMSNLVAQSTAHLLYAADWNGRQVTQNRDDFGAYGGDVGNYGSNPYGDCIDGIDDCHPPIIAGIGPTLSGSWVTWAYWATSGNNFAFQPINFPGPPNSSSSADGWGYWRFPQTRPIHDYLNGRYHDPVFFAPNDTSVIEPIAGCLDEPPEFIAYPSECNPAWSSYGRSPAAMFHPDVFRSNADGGWQAAWELDHGYESPGFFQATYSDLKTHIIEHSWVQNPPAPCNPVFFGCEPYYFNAGIDSAPVTLFYDGHVRLLPNSEVLFADFQVLAQTGQIDGLWHRGTPFGTGGYQIENGFDGVPLSHHVLTTDGILGRDTLGGALPMESFVRWQPPAFTGSRRAIAAQRAAAASLPFAPAAD
jgi:type II secretory pathway pseudopilin PulG